MAFNKQSLEANRVTTGPVPRTGDWQGTTDPVNCSRIDDAKSQWSDRVWLIGASLRRRIGGTLGAFAVEMCFKAG